MKFAGIVKIKEGSCMEFLFDRNQHEIQIRVEKYGPNGISNEWCPIPWLVVLKILDRNEKDLLSLILSKDIKDTRIVMEKMAAKRNLIKEFKEKIRILEKELEEL